MKHVCSKLIVTEACFKRSSLSQYKIHRCHNIKFIAATIQNSSLPKYKIHRCHNTKCVGVTIQTSHWLYSKPVILKPFKICSSVWSAFICRATSVGLINLWRLYPFHQQTSEADTHHYQDINKCNLFILMVAFKPLKLSCHCTPHFTPCIFHKLRINGALTVNIDYFYTQH